MKETMEQRLDRLEQYTIEGLLLEMRALAKYIGVEFVWYEKDSKLVAEKRAAKKGGKK